MSCCEEYSGVLGGPTVLTLHLWSSSPLEGSNNRSTVRCSAREEDGAAASGESEIQTERERERESDREEERERERHVHTYIYICVYINK